MRTAPGRRKLTWGRWLARRLGLRPTPLGDRGEQIAAKFLRKRGMKIIARNRVHRRGEIDIIALDATDVVFIEVRTRSSDSYMSPESSIRYWKRKTLIATVRGLMRKQKVRGGEIGLRPRIDVVAVVWPRGERRPREVRWHRGVIAVGGW